jgi:hypothetical protein
MKNNTKKSKGKVKVLSLTRKERKRRIEELYKNDKKNMKELSKKERDIFKLCLRLNLRSPRSTRKCNHWRKYKI